MACATIISMFISDLDNKTITQRHEIDTLVMILRDPRTVRGEFRNAMQFIHNQRMLEIAKHKIEGSNA